MYTGSQKILWTTKQSIVWNSNLSGSPCKCYYIQAREKNGTLQGNVFVCLYSHGRVRDAFCGKNS